MHPMTDNAKKSMHIFSNQIKSIWNRRRAQIWKGKFSSNLSEWLYICKSSSTDDLEPLTTLIAPVAIIPEDRFTHYRSCSELKNVWFTQIQHSNSSF